MILYSGALKSVHDWISIAKHDVWETKRERGYISGTQNQISFMNAATAASCKQIPIKSFIFPPASALICVDNLIAILFLILKTQLSMTKSWLKSWVGDGGEDKDKRVYLN